MYGYKLREGLNLNPRYFWYVANFRQCHYLFQIVDSLDKPKSRCCEY